MEIQEITGFFKEELFVADLKGKTRDEVLDELTEKFISGNFIKNHELVLDMLHRRESVGSTGIGHGIAIPHGRTTAAPELTIAFGKSSAGVEWEALDGEPVHLVFLVIAPPYEENNHYLPTLGKLVEFLSKAENRDRLKAIDNFQDFISLFSQ